MDMKQKYTLSTVIAITLAFTLIVFALAKMQSRFATEAELFVPRIMLVLAGIIILIEYIFYKAWLLKNSK